MSKPAWEWWECTPGPLNWPEPAATRWIQAIIDDARAGMVPEGELAKAHAGMDLFEKRLQHEVDSREAELARAWCAGRDAAADWHDAHGSWDCPTHYLAGEPAGPKGSAAIRALRPPGGKPK